MRTLLQDIRYGLRTLIKRPSFMIIAVLTIAIGIGANTAIFTVVNATLLRGLPYQAPERLMHLWETTPQKDFPRREASYPDYQDWRQNQVFTGLTAYAGCGMILSGKEARESIPCARVAADFFSVLGVEPALGRTFQPGEDQPGAPKVVLLTHAAWQRRFGGDPKIIGQTLRLNDEAWTVIGVLPLTFHFAPRGASEIWAPLIPNEMMRANRRAHWVNIIARLKPGLSLTQAETEMNVIGRHIADQYPDTHTRTGIKLVPLHEEIIGDVKPLMLALIVAVSLVLLIACANVANLLLVRAASRQKEIAIRVALGASRWRIVRQLLIECLLLAIVGGGLGLLMADQGVRALVAAIPDVRLSAMPYLRGLSIDGRVLAFTSGLTFLTGLIFGLVPALQSSRPALQETLKEGGKTSSSAANPWLRDLLVIAEIALALVLLVGAGLMMKSLVHLLRVDPGFNAENLLTQSFTVTGDKYKDEAARAVFHQQLLGRLESLPGVKGVATVDVLPLVGGNTTRCYVASRSVPPPGEETEANVRTVSANYFRVMEVPLIRGRHFTDQDNKHAPQVIIINQTLAQRLFMKEEAVGQRLIFPGANNNAYEIVGVVGDEKVNGLASKTTSVVYGPFLQDTDRSAVLMVRTVGDPMRLASIVRRESLEMESGIAIHFTRTMDNIISNLPATFLRRFPALLIGIFGAIALLLAGVGIYGVISFAVAQRTHEIGVRMALGAQQRDVLKLVVRQGLNMALIGVVIGLIAAFALTRLMTSLLFGVSPRDPMTFTLIALLLIAVSLLACYIPARRATKVDPLVALRYE